LFFGELREEGLALIDETDAEKLSNRCFKVAEIFMRQRQRRINQLSSTGTTLHEDRRPAGPPEPRLPLPPRPRPEIPIEQRLPDDPAKLSKEETEALIEEAQEVAEMKAQASPEAEAETPAAAETSLSSPAPEVTPASSASEEIHPSSASEATDPSSAPAEEASSAVATPAPAPVILPDAIVPEVSAATDATAAEATTPEAPPANESHPAT
jgi:hypothetical protein